MTIEQLLALITVLATLGGGPWWLATRLQRIEGDLAQLQGRIDARFAEVNRRIDDIKHMFRSLRSAMSKLVGLLGQSQTRSGRSAAFRGLTAQQVADVMEKLQVDSARGALVSSAHATGNPISEAEVNRLKELYALFKDDRVPMRSLAEAEEFKRLVFKLTDEKEYRDHPEAPGLGDLAEMLVEYWIGYSERLAQDAEDDGIEAEEAGNNKP